MALPARSKATRRDFLKLAAAGAAGGALLGNEAVKRTVTINVTLPVHSGAADRDSAVKN